MLLLLLCSAGKFTLREAGAIRFDSIFDEYVRYISPECHAVCVAPQLQCCCSTRRDFSTTITNIYCLLIAQCCCCCCWRDVTLWPHFLHSHGSCSAHAHEHTTLFPLDVRSPSLSLPRSFSSLMRVCAAICCFVFIYTYAYIYI